MKKTTTLATLVSLAVILLFAAPAAAQQTYEQADLEGNWIIYLYGAYETKTEHMFGTLSLNGDGVLTSGTNTYRGDTGAFIGGNLAVDANGIISGFLSIETWALRFDVIRALMDQSKTEVTGFVTGQWHPCLIRMIKASGEPAPEPGEEEEGGEEPEEESKKFQTRN